MGKTLAEFPADTAPDDFRSIPYFDKHTDRLRCFFEDRRAYSHFVNEYLSFYLAMDDNTPVGFEIRRISVVQKAIENMGVQNICDPVKIPNGDEVCLSMLFRQAASPSELDKNDYAAINEKTRGITCPKLETC